MTRHVTVYVPFDSPLFRETATVSPEGPQELSRVDPAEQSS